MAGKASIKKGDSVEYKWGSGKVEGKVTSVSTSDTEAKIKGKTIKRKASKEEPAVEVRTTKGGRALKSASEVKVK